MGAVAEKKVVCKSALVHLDEATAAILRDSFKQFRIHAVDISTTDGDWYGREKFDAGVVRLEPGCEVLLEAIRASRINRNMVIYGISMPGQHLKQVSKYGINVMLNHPLDRQAALKVVRSTHLLVLHEFRRYVRVPVIAEVKLEFERSAYTGTSIELSGGGMSMHCKSSLKLGNVVETSFSLPNTKLLSCSAVVSWVDGDQGMIGIRFDPADDRRSHIKSWIEEYLEI